MLTNSYEIFEGQNISQAKKPLDIGSWYGYSNF